MKLNRRLSCALMLLVMCVGLTAFGALLQVLNIVPDQAERTQTAEVQDLPTRIAMANATRHVELTATMLARPTATFTTSPTFTSTATPLPTNTPVPTETPPTAAFDEQAYISALTLALEVVASERNILSVQVADGRANGGERVAIVSYATIETTSEGLVVESADIFDAIGAGIEVNGLDIDAVTLVVADSNELALGLITAQVDAIQSWRDGVMSSEDFLRGLVIEDM